MKKILLILALAVILPAGVFAHPSGFGIGVVYQYDLGFYDGLSTHGGSVGLSLKTPSSPVYLGIYFSAKDDYINFNLTGDRFMIDNYLGKESMLCFFIGVGGYFRFGFTNYDEGDNQNSANVGVGARIPIGIGFFPLSFMEFFAAVTPSLGLELVMEKNIENPLRFPVGRLGFDLGFRLWL